MDATVMHPVVVAEGVVVEPADVVVGDDLEDVDADVDVVPPKEKCIT